MFLSFFLANSDREPILQTARRGAESNIAGPRSRNIWSHFFVWGGRHPSLQHIIVWNALKVDPIFLPPFPHSSSHTNLGLEMVGGLGP